MRGAGTETGAGPVELMLQPLRPDRGGGPRQLAGHGCAGGSVLLGDTCASELSFVLANADPFLIATCCWPPSFAAS